MTLSQSLIRRSSIALLVLASSASFAGNFYKWTDEKGVVHYSERAPEGQKETETVKTYNTRNTGVQSKLAESPQAEEGAEQSSEAPEEVQKDAALCARAKKDQQTLKTRPIVKQAGKVLSIDQKNEQIQKLQDVINVHC